MRAASVVPSLIVALVVASLATTTASATVVFDFEPPAYTAGTLHPLVSQDGWVSPPAQPGVTTISPSVVDPSFSFAAFGNGTQKVAVANTGGPGASRGSAEHLNIVHDLTKPLWTYQFDFVMEPDGDSSVSTPPGVGPEFSLVPRDPTPGATPTARTFALSWNIEQQSRIATNVSAYDATGQPFNEQLFDTGPGQDSGWMSMGLWYTFKIEVNPQTNQFVRLEWAPLGTTTPNTYWTGFYLAGGATSTLPAPNGIRLSNSSSWLAGFDNISIDTQTPEPTTAAILLLTATALTRRRQRI
jgi:hypothetical protein